MHPKPRPKSKRALDPNESKALLRKVEAAGIEYLSNPLGFNDISNMPTHNPTHGSALLNIEAHAKDIYSNALKAVSDSRQEVQKLLTDVHRDEHFTLGLLGGALSSLKDAQQAIEQLRRAP